MFSASGYASARVRGRSPSEKFQYLGPRAQQPLPALQSQATRDPEPDSQPGSLAALLAACQKILPAPAFRGRVPQSENRLLCAPSRPDADRLLRILCRRSSECNTTSPLRVQSCRATDEVVPV